VRSVTVWDRLGRAAGATGLTVALFVTVAAEAVAIAHSWGIQYWLVGGLAATAVCVLALLRRRQPMWMAVAGLTVAALTILAARLAGLPSEPGPAMALALSVLAGAAIRALPLAPAIAVAGGGLAVVAASFFTARPASAGVVLTINGAAWLAAVAVGSVLRQRDDRARSTIEKVRREERMELARELHDVVGHHITAVLIHAQATQVLARRDPARVPDALANIEAAAAEGLTAMRRVVGILREAGEGPPASPGPAAPAVPAPHSSPEGVGALVERFGRQGLPVRLEEPEGKADWPSEVTSTVYRIVREALTNVARHAPEATAVTVTIGHDPHGVTVEVVNAAPPAPVRHHHTGYGLMGMRERITALGGTLRTGPRAEGGWSLVATVPVARRGSR
jgi:signal transduction histidine kinase